MLKKSLSPSLTPTTKMIERKRRLLKKGWDGLVLDGLVLDELVLDGMMTSRGGGWWRRLVLQGLHWYVLVEMDDERDFALGMWRRGDGCAGRQREEGEKEWEGWWCGRCVSWCEKSLM